MAVRPGDWAGLERTWRDGDVVEIRIPMEPRMVPVDRQHPRRVAVVRGVITSYSIHYTKLYDMIMSRMTIAISSLLSS